MAEAGYRPSDDLATLRAVVGRRILCAPKPNENGCAGCSRPPWQNGKDVAAPWKQRIVAAVSDGVSDSALLRRQALARHAALPERWLPPASAFRTARLRDRECGAASSTGIARAQS